MSGNVFFGKMIVSVTADGPKPWSVQQEAIVRLKWNAYYGFNAHARYTTPAGIPIPKTFAEWQSRWMCLRLWDDIDRQQRQEIA